MSDPTQAQAEDRRAQVIEEAESYLEWLREGGNGDVADSITALLVELSRLSRVEQALREALSFFADETLLDAVDDDTMSGIRPCPPSTCMRIRDVRRWHQALSASPSSEPKER